MYHFVCVFIHLVAVVVDDEGPPQNKKATPSMRKDTMTKAAVARKLLK
jgi:hypothetical protein